MSEIECIRKFESNTVLQNDLRSKRIIILGKIENISAIVIAEKTAFDLNTSEHSFSFTSISELQLLDSNDVYRWYRATIIQDVTSMPSLKLSLIWPATAAHIAKYSSSKRRLIVETPELYSLYHEPYINSMRGERLRWVYNILDHRVESDRIVYENSDKLKGFILLPDLKWDRVSTDSLYLVAIVHRRDIFSIRDLNKTHLNWLKEMRDQILTKVCESYPDLQPTQLRLYFHYLPSYYHLHVHVTNVLYDSGGDGTMAGRAILMNDVISRLENMSDSVGGFQNADLSFLISESSELWIHGFSQVVQ
ncbi:HIT-like domain-containing protein [Lipomyces oligophaga]|uniref:HIT-like domain-containing protein n=1 Tax=Lipomyces oligophaga TaxID=45792 RepID=UPI0034CD5168